MSVRRLTMQVVQLGVYKVTWWLGVLLLAGLWFVV